MAGAASLSDKIQKGLNDELNGDNVEDVCQRLKSMKGLDSVSPVHESCRRLYHSDGKQNDYYPFKENRKGLVAIINNFTIESDVERFRKGTIEDQQKIVNFLSSDKFAPLYHIEEPELNLRYNEFDTFLDNLAIKLKQGKDSYHSFFLFILSHGDESGVQTFCSGKEEPQAMAIEKITARFKDCLPDCPKVFVIQACQGRFDNRPQYYKVMTDDAGPASGGYQLDGSESNTETESVDTSVRYIEVGPPETADMLIALAAVKGYVAYRTTDNAGLIGSWFIQELFQELEEAHNKEYYSSHLLDLLTNVQDIVSQKLGKQMKMKRATHGEEIVKQMPCFQSSLTKKLYLLPPDLPR